MSQHRHGSGKARGAAHQAPTAPHSRPCGASARWCPARRGVSTGARSQPVRRCAPLRTWMLLVSAWPMCSAPVTLGGGITMTNLGLLDPCFGVKKPHFSHQVYQPDSTTRGQYALAISPDMSLRVPGGSARAASRAACSSASACASFASFSAFSACAVRRSRAACQHQAGLDRALPRRLRTFFLGALALGASAAAAAALAMLLAAFSALSRACGPARASAQRG